MGRDILEVGMNKGWYVDIDIGMDISRGWDRDKIWIEIGCGYGYG